jgi:hypothetical protein
MKTPFRFLLLSASGLLIFLFINNNRFNAFFAMSHPAVYEKSYQLFVDKCSNCHTIDVAIAVDSYLPSAWETVVDQMRRKPDSKISKDEAKEIYQYLVYDSTVSHKTELDAELKALPEDKRAIEEQKIKEAQR